MEARKLAWHLYHRRFPVLLSLLLTVLGIGGSGAVAAQTSRIAPQATTVHDGEALFRGLFFGSGPVAKLFPEIWDNPQVLRYMSGSPEAAALEDRVIPRLWTQDPTFFARFGAELQSGDHLRIERALDEAGRLVSRAVSAELGDLANPGEGVDVFVVVTQHVDVLVAVIEDEVFRVRTESSLQREVWIDVIAARLRPTAAE